MTAVAAMEQQAIALYIRVFANNLHTMRPVAESEEQSADDTRTLGFTVELDDSDDSLMVDLDGGSNGERLALLLRLSEWVMRDGRGFGMTRFRITLTDHELSFCGATMRIRGDYCAASASREVEKWLLMQGIEELVL